jgi:hypothetical protein
MRASHRVGIEDIRRLYRGAPASNLRSLAASLVRKKGEMGEEEEAVYIGTEGSQLRQELGRIYGRLIAGVSGRVTSENSVRRKKKAGLTDGARCQRKIEGEDTDSGTWRCWAAAGFCSGPGFISEALFLFSFFLFSSFSFSVFLFASYILHKCFKSNQTNCKSFLKLKLTF